MVIHAKIHGKAAEWLRTQEVVEDRRSRRGDLDDVPEVVSEKKEKEKGNKKTL